MSRFDRLASQWDLNPRRVESARKTTSKLKELIDIKDFEILDYGAGSGLITFDLFENAKSVVAMDNSQGMLSEIEKKVKEAGISNIFPTFHDANIGDFKKDSYDLVVTAMTLHHIKRPFDFIKNVTSTLKKDGYLVISDLESEDGTFHSKGSEGVEHFGFDKEDIKSWFEKAGLEVVFCQTNEIIKKHRDFNVFLVIGKNV